MAGPVTRAEPAPSTIYQPLSIIHIHYPENDHFLPGLWPALVPLAAFTCAGRP